MPTPKVQFGRDICNVLDDAESREWLVTNGMGGFASGTVAGSMARRYHGLLIAALQPPAARTYLVSGLDETIRYWEASVPLAAHRWASGVVDPQGYLYLQSFHLEATKPVWTYAFADALLEKRVWMRQGENTTYVQYTLARASASVELNLKALVNYRDFHACTHAGDWHMNIVPVENGVMVLAFDGATPFYVKSSGAFCEPAHEWYNDFSLPVEAERGLEDHEDHLFAARFRTTLAPGASVTLVCTTEAKTLLDGENARAQSFARETKLLKTWQDQDSVGAAEAPGWLPQLIHAADQFVVKRALPGEPDGCSIIAGYPWFGDWGRDTMIALPGLTLVTGRTELAKKILLAYLCCVDGGMLPNNFPASGSKLEYNTMDAALWYFQAVREYFAATQDAETLGKLFTALAGIIEAYTHGARYNIHVDPEDGLVSGGGPGVQLTWMDAKIGDWVVTPRMGKPVEINALWINALDTMVQFATQLRKSADKYQTALRKAQSGFAKFWNDERNCCFDVIDSPDVGRDASLRPNQIFAVSLPVSPLSAAQQKAVVDVCARDLLTSYGLRSLAPSEPGYAGHYSGGPRDRDAAYHQGTVWGWLLGPFVSAHFRVYQDRAAALRFLEPLANSLQVYGLGTLAEIFDGAAPFTPRGCIAQAWTVGEVLRAYHEVSKSSF